MKDYIQGKRQGKEANKLERDAQSDPFLQDAIDGFDAVDDNHWHAIENLEEKLNLRIKTTKNSENNRHWFIGIAASIALLIGFGSLVYFNLHDSEKSAIAKSDAIPENAESSWIYSAEEESLKEEVSLSDTEPIIAEAAPPPPPSAAVVEQVLSIVDNMVIAADASYEAEAPIILPPPPPPAVMEETADYDASPNAYAPKEAARANRRTRQAESADLAEQKSAKPTSFGETEFKEYFEKNRTKNICSEKEASIEVRFYVDNTGTPTDLKIEKSTCDELEKELIKLLKNGPKWTTTEQKVVLSIRLE